VYRFAMSHGAVCRWRASMCVVFENLIQRIGK
jgi:hypothetical protein